MKILFDHQVFSIQKFGGASKYYCELLKNIPRENWDTTTLFSNNEYVKSSHLFEVHDCFPNWDFKRKTFMMNTFNKPYSLYRLYKRDYDIFHQTHFETYCLKAIGNKKMVTTFHDMNHVKFREMYHYNFFHNKNWMEAIQKKSISRADKIIAISQNTKKDLIDYWNIEPEKIVVIHHGVEKNRIQNLSLKKIVNYPYILFVGERDGFKNFDKLAIAFSLLSKKYKDLRLVCTGKPFGEAEIKRLIKLEILEKTIQTSASERTMAMLYRDAELFAYPSLSEGFGMPILEAMVYDCPVALSTTSCFPEIAGDAGVYFDPYQIGDIVEKIASLLDSSVLKAKQIALEHEQLKLYSWEKTAKEYIDVYRSLL